MKDKTVLIVEDEIIVALDIKNSVRKFGFNVCSIAATYEDAIKDFNQYSPDIILLDINLRNSKSGIEVGEYVKKIHEQQIIIYLTAFTDDKTIERAKKTNPQAYLIKPFRDPDLRMALDIAIEKNSSYDKGTNSNIVELGRDYYFDFNEKRLLYKNYSMPLPEKEKRLIQKLAERKGKVVSFLELEKFIWEIEVSKNNLKSLVHRLRAKTAFLLINTYATGYKIE